MFTLARWFGIAVVEHPMATIDVGTEGHPGLPISQTAATARLRCRVRDAARGGAIHPAVCLGIEAGGRSASTGSPPGPSRQRGVGDLGRRVWARSPPQADQPR